MNDIPLNFEGPFTFTEGARSVFHSHHAQAAGVYLWTVRQRNDDTHLIHYVGETTDLAKRQREHLVQILGLNYGIFDPDKAQAGISELIWPGLWRDKSADGPGRLFEAYSQIGGVVMRYVAVMNIFFARLEIDNGMRKHIEGCIGWHLRKKHPEAKALYPDDNHVGARSEKNNGQLLISAPELIRGLDSTIAY